MKNENWNEPFIPEKAFFTAWIAVAFPVLYLTTPWDSELPWFSKLAGILLFPFFATVVVYCPIAFLKKLLRSGKEGLKVLRIFTSCILGVLIIILPVWILKGMEPVNSWTVIGVSVWATWYLNTNLNNMSANKNLE